MTVLDGWSYSLKALISPKFSATILQPFEKKLPKRVSLVQEFPISRVDGLSKLHAILVLIMAAVLVQETVG